jgi:deoxyribose-phosphate aldolase
MTLDAKSLAERIDHTLLKPDAGFLEIDALCREALLYGFATVCVNPVWVSTASGILRGGIPRVCSVVGFPLGATTCMDGETARAVEDGASEIDMVIPVGHLKAGDSTTVSRTIERVVVAASGRPVKVILETCLLTNPEKVEACRLAAGSGASWVKTSTGFSTGGATVEDIRLMVASVGGRLGVKASGGIRSLSDALVMLEAGAGRLGSSSSVRIIEEIGS